MNNTKLFAISFLATLLIISSVPLYLYLKPPESTDQITDQIALNKFSSYEELKTFLETSSSTPGLWLRPGVVRGDAVLESSEFSVKTTTPEPAASDYSKTNIQVGGVDEADIVKTDGEYIYIVSGGNVTIVKAYPPEEAEVMSKISFNGTITGIFVNDDRLIVLGNTVRFYGWLTRDLDDGEFTSMYQPPETCIKVYDVILKQYLVDYTVVIDIHNHEVSSGFIIFYIYLIYEI